jgi:hypothetical protein
MTSVHVSDLDHEVYESNERRERGITSCTSTGLLHRSCWCMNKTPLAERLLAKIYQ